MNVNKFKKLVCNLYDKKDYVDQIRSLKQAFNNALKIKKIHRVLNLIKLHGLNHILIRIQKKK